MIRRPPKDTVMTPSFPTRRSSDLASISRSLRLNGAAFLWRFQSGRKATCGTPRLSAQQAAARSAPVGVAPCSSRSEEHTSELQSLMRISYAVFCLKKKTQKIQVKKTFATRNITNLHQ